MADFSETSEKQSDCWKYIDNPTAFLYNQLVRQDKKKFNELRKRESFSDCFVLLYIRKTLGVSACAGRIGEQKKHTAKAGDQMKLERTNVTNQIIEYLKQNIEKGIWQEGEKIPSENQLTKELGVSRASVRTAIQHLAGLGILESVHGKGTYLMNADVKNWKSDSDVITLKDCQDIAKVLEFRQILEPQACLLAVKRADEKLVPALEKYLKQMKKNLGNQEQFVHADLKFHEAICKAADNPLLLKSLSRVFRETKQYHQKMNDLFGYEEGIRYHEQILEAVRQQDAQEAQQLMQAHLQNGMDHL